MLSGAIIIIIIMRMFQRLSNMAALAKDCHL